MTNIIKYFLMASILMSCASNKLKQKSVTEKKADLYYSEGTNKLVQGEYEEALSNLIEAYKYGPEDSKINNNLGMAYFFKNKKKLALKYLKRAVGLDEKNSDARNNYASILYKLGHYRQAQQQYQLVLNDLVYKFQYRTHYNLALISLKFNNPKEAKRHLYLSIKNNKDYCPAHYKLGLMSKETFQYHKALEEFKKATLGTCYKSPAPHFYQGKMLTLLEKYDSALLKYKEIMENFPESRYSILATKELRKIKVQSIRKERSKQAKRKIFKQVGDGQKVQTVPPTQF